MSKLPSRYWWDLSTRDFAAADVSDVVAILPVGAVEQHGPHLPVRVDAAINAGILAQALALMPDDLPALVLPTMPVGKSDEHLAYPGTLTLPHDLLGRMWFELAACVHRAGVKRIIFFNSHGGQPQLIDIVCRDLRVKLGMLAINASWSGLVDIDDLFDTHELKHGIHGGEVETSVMLHLHPDLVAMKQAEDFAPLSVTMERQGGRLTPEGRIGFGWQAQDLERSGASGNAGAADARRGEIIVSRAAHGLVELCAEASAFPLSVFEAKPLFERAEAVS